MNYMQEYLGKAWTPQKLIAELIELIKLYNKTYGTYLIIYAVDKDRDIPITAKMLSTRDYQVLFDMLNPIRQKNLDFYIETPGGSGEAAEDIVKLTRRNFDCTHFIIAGESKSAGTLMVLSGNEISMTDSGSLGPIDAQMTIGRSTISAHDYMDWVKKKQAIYEEKKDISPFDAIMIAQISPGELVGVDNALKYAHDLVVGWLPKYKFANWKKTETQKKTVTNEMKQKKALQIAKKLSNHTTWRSHGRSLKIEDLKELGLKINRIDDDETKSELVYKINTVLRMVFIKSPIFKVFATADAKLFEHANPAPLGATPIPGKQLQLQQDIEIIEINIGCKKCSKQYKFYAKFIDNPNIEQKMQEKGVKPLPKDKKMTCENCGNLIELEEVKKQIEAQTKRKVL